MKKITFYLFSLMFISSIVTQAQNGKKIPDNITANTDQLIRCGSDEYNARLLQNNPNMMGSQAFEEIVKNKIQEAKQQRTSNQMVVVTIPVVVHVFHNGETVGTGPNITDAQVISQITVLNEDYRRLLGTPGYNVNPVGADVEVEFCLAQTDPNGSPTNGIDRVNIGQNGIFEANLSDAQNQMDALKPSSIWDPANYMNMWSVAFNGGSGLLGYAQFPGGPADTDGVVADYRFFGSSDYNDGTFNLSAPFDKGRTMTHEVGHFLGLYHTFQEGCAGTGSTGGDFCADTPAVGSPNYGCPTGTDSCPSDAGLDMIENYMDYSDDACMNVFTVDQKARVQAVLASQVNRASLTSSSVCNSPTTPFINFSPGSPSPGQVAEGSDCNFLDYTIDLTMTIPASANATASLTNSGTAVDGEDFMLINNTVTFNSGSTTPSNSITLRVFNDGVVEADETIILSINVSTTGDAVADSDTYNYIIENDDDVVISAGNAVLFSDGFEAYADFDISPVGGWTLIDNDGDSTYDSTNTDFTNEGYTGSFIVFNPSATTPASNTGWDAHTGSKGYYCFNSTGNVSGVIQNDDYAITPQINLNGTGSELKFWAKSLTDNYAGGERFQVGISTTNTNASSFTIISPAPYIIPPLTWTEYTYDLSAYDGQNIYVAIHVVSADEFVFMLDDISVTSNVTTGVQTTVNTSTPDQNNLIGAGQTFYRDVNSNDIMIDVDNIGTFDYGCTSVAVSRDATTAGAGAVSYSGGTNVAGYVTAKTFDITTTNIGTGAATVNFYFTEGELATWEAITGENRSALYVKNDSTGEVVPVTISAFGTDSKLEASFSNGLDGTYYFGSQLAFLSVGEFELANSISIYPNPTVNVLIVKVDNDNDLPNAYKIYNMLGQLITGKNINNVQDLTIDTAPFSNGMYFIKISKAGNAITLPFIKK
ncbi:T9SS-dependent choice-of-anchor J family protein [Olleya aquimaris]|uniref:Putative secreted protein (Por secretion system target) n=1 Tax=Olleya aquimaris TaxID=639310 RepID=A0A327RMP6_9FLAO|nr:choice-of-anchor J domain-containing protein [Olleya aquimaris]RAJ15007.1 putative secreted protein (Por secretion system target) [Olleya aquimaris]